MFCAYKNIFGEPKKGIHQYRLFGLAIFDVLGLIGINYIISSTYNIDFFQLLIVLILLTILIHYIFCVPTALNTALGIAEEKIE